MLEIVLYNHKTCSNIANFNARSKTLLYKNISLTLYSRKGWSWLCVRGELETGTDCYILTPSYSDHSSNSSSSWLGYSTVGHWGPKALCLPLAFNSASRPQLTPTPTGTDWNWPTPSVAPGYIIVYVHLLPLFLCLFTCMYILCTSLDWRLGRGSIHNNGTVRSFNCV